MKKEIKEFDRIELFKHYNNCDNPFIILTTKIEVTNVVEFCKENKHFYATIGYLINKCANEIPEFRYRYENGNIYLYEKLNSNYTQKIDNKITFFSLEMNNSYKNYIENYDKKLKLIKIKEKEIVDKNDEIWFSCLPWMSFTGLIPPFRKECYIPQFIWDKYEFDNGKYYMHIMIMAHHGFVDGYHIYSLIDKLQKEINCFKKS